MKLRVFTDGACSGNPGPGGWATLFLYPEGRKVISGHSLETTNNRMELLAVVKALFYGLEDFKYESIEIHSDSAYVVNALTKGWLEKWQQGNWKTSKGEAVKNYDLWKRLLSYLSMAEKSNVSIKFVKVKGHDGNCFNELVDQEARRESNIAKKKVEAEGNDLL